MIKTWLIVIFALFLATAPANADEVGPNCYGLAGVSPPAPLPNLKPAKIVGNGPSFFLVLIFPDCAANPAQLKCRLPGQPYLVAGDGLIVTDATPGYQCVEYAKQTAGYFVGWMPNSRIKIDTPSVLSVPLSSWIGTWRHGSTTIILSRRGNHLLAYGDAVWQGSVSPTPNFGSINASGVPQGNTLYLGSSGPINGCKVRLLLWKNLLAAVDNLSCGGENVTFSGIYIRKAR